MAKARNLSGKEISKILEQNGFQLVRQKGSHLAFKNEDNRTVIVPDHRVVAIGTLGSIIRQSGLPKELFQ